MNRHNKFYAAIDDEMDCDDDYAYDDDYNYDEEAGEGEDYGSGEEEPRVGGAHEATPAPAVYINPYSTISPEKDEDFELLDTHLTNLHALWKTSALTLRPLTEAEAVAALRQSNYVNSDAVTLLKAQRSAEKARGGGGVSLRVSTNPSRQISTVPMPSYDDDTPGDGNDDESGDGIADTPGTASSPVASRSSKTSAKRRTKQMLEMKPDPSKPDCTFIMAGHVDAGKSTTLGHLLLLLGNVSMEDVDRNEKDGRSSHKESFKYAWLLDQSEEERRRGVTIDSGSFCFETPHRRVHVLDAPGHKDFVLSMMSSATQADAAILVVNAATSEFETGLQYGTREHLLVLKILGVGSIVVAINKMDAVQYSKDRFDYIVAELRLLLKQTRVAEETVIGFCPMSGMTGANMTEVNRVAMPWYDGPCLLDIIDSCPLDSRLLTGPLRLSLQDVQGSTLYAKVESGKLFREDTVQFVPSDVRVLVKSIQKPTVAGPVLVAFAGETVEITTPSSCIGLYPGCVGCESANLIACSTDFEAHIQTFPSLERSLLPGATLTMVLHSLTIRVRVAVLISKMDGKTGAWSKGMVKCIPAGAQGLVLLRAESKIALEPATECRALGRFVLQQDGETVAGGLVRRVVT